MEYKYKDGNIYQDDNIVYTIKSNSSTLGAKSIEISSASGLQSIYIDKAPGGYKISQGSMDMGTLSRNLAMDYNGKKYSLSKPYVDNDTRKMDILSDESKVGTLTFGAGELTGTYNYMNDEIPAIVYMSVLSPYIRQSYNNPAANGMGNRANMYRMPRIYAILSNVIFLIAIVIILFSNSLGIPAEYDFLILIIVIALSFVIRSMGRKKYREQHQNNNEEDTGMNKNL
jgi:hypothetical protein